MMRFLQSSSGARRLCCKPNMKVLNVAEKNDAAKNLSEIMSGGRYRRREGLSRFNKIYEFDYRLLGANCKMSMTSVSGHLLNLDFTLTHRKWFSCSPVELFDAPVAHECPKDYDPIKRTLEREARYSDALVIWTDCDREGENIGFQIVSVCRKAKPSICVYRARFSEITPGAVSRACQNLVPPDPKTNAAVEVRRELDLRIGAAFTRLLTLRLKREFPEVLDDRLVSYGSCQFPTLGFVVERYREIQNFVAETFWRIEVTHVRDDVAARFLWKRRRIFDYQVCFLLYERCLQSGTPTARVVGVESKPKSKWRPQPMDTVELEKVATRKLRLTAKATMQIAEKLYTDGLISYPRTETTRFPSDLHLEPLVRCQTDDPSWGGETVARLVAGTSSAKLESGPAGFAARLLREGPTPRQGTKSDQAHPPIHPVKYAPNLQGDAKRVYELVVRHFLACLSKDAEGKETTVEIDVSGERFLLTGLVILARNYLDVYPYDKWNAKIIPHYERDQTFVPASIMMLDGETSPPPLLREADLIALMEKHCIGTDATHAEHIETVKKRLYVASTEEGYLLPGELGMGLVEGYDSMGLEMSKPHLRAALEADLKRICEGTVDPRVVLRRQVNQYRDAFLRSESQIGKLTLALRKYFRRSPDRRDIGDTGRTDDVAERAGTGTAPSRRGRPGYERRCGVCGRTGHTRRNCSRN